MPHSLWSQHRKDQFLGQDDQDDQDDDEIDNTNEGDIQYDDYSGPEIESPDEIIMDNEMEVEEIEGDLTV